jgi:DNA polymerase-3 subunit alpha
MSNEEAFSKISNFYTKEEFDEMCENSLEIMNKIEEYDLFRKPTIPEVSVPDIKNYDDEALILFPTLYNLRKNGNIQERYWVNECLKSLGNKNLLTKEYMERLEIEADVISYISQKLDNCLYSYFNTMAYYINLFWDCGSPVGPGRGSATGFLSNYLLGITQLDPIKWDLPWFRFLNKERAELPKQILGK